MSLVNVRPSLCGRSLDLVKWVCFGCFTMSFGYLLKVNLRVYLGINWRLLLVFEGLMGVFLELIRGFSQQVEIGILTIIW